MMDSCVLAFCILLDLATTIAFEVDALADPTPSAAGGGKSCKLANGSIA